jgi:hypothetical protein
MKHFLAVYTGSAEASAKMQPSEAQMKAGMDAWKKWATDNAASIVDGGSPLGKTKRIDKSGVADTRNNLAAYTVVQAETYDAAARLFVNHPHFTIFPGDAVEVMECLPMPKA